MSTKSSSLDCARRRNSDYANSLRAAPSTFVKLNRKSCTNKGLGHSTLATRNFDRRNSITTQSSGGETTSNYVSKPTPVQQQRKSRSLPYVSHTKSNNNFQFTEQRCNYERMMQQQQQKQQLQCHQLAWPSSTSSVVNSNFSQSRIPSRYIDRDNEVTSMPESDALTAEFLALREFRLKYTNECFGSGRQHELLQSQPIVDKATKEAENYWSGKLKSRTSPMPYALKQSLLRNQLAKDFSNRITQLKFIKQGLNKSLALSYQPMYN